MSADDARNRAERIERFVREARHELLLEWTEPTAETVLHLVTLFEEIDTDIGWIRMHLDRQAPEPDDGNGDHAKEIRGMVHTLARRPTQ